MAVISYLRFDSDSLGSMVVNSSVAHNLCRTGVVTFRAKRIGLDQCELYRLSDLSGLRPRCRGRCLLQHDLPTSIRLAATEALFQAGDEIEFGERALIRIGEGLGVARNAGREDRVETDKVVRHELFREFPFATDQIKPEDFQRVLL